MTELNLNVYVSPEHEIPSGGRFSATTATLIEGPTESALVDTGFTLSDVEEIARRIDASGASLKFICVTHAHPDHYFGTEWLLNRYPEARAVAAPSVVAAIKTTLADDRKRWSEWLAGVALDNSVIPEEVEDGSITIDGHVVEIVEVGQGDIADSAIVHVPDLRAVVSGDVTYNGFHPFMAATGPEEWADWARSIEQIEALNPEVVIAGHKKKHLPDDAERAAQGTKEYLRAFAEELERTDSTRDLVEAMQHRYPDLGNPSALINSAKTATKRKRTKNA